MVQSIEEKRVETDICIIGAGPVGLFAVFEAGLLKMRCHLIDALPQIGGQLSEIYPKKPIYDIPGYPDVLAQDLVTNLEKQITPFAPTATLGERVEELERLEDDSFRLQTNEGTEVFCKVVVIAGGLGCFEPRRPAIENLEQYEGKGIAYIIKNPEKFRGKKLVLAGGGDSALDWTLYLSELAEEITLVHRGSSFRGAPDSAEKVMSLADKKKINLQLNANVTAIQGNGTLNACVITDKAKNSVTVDTDYFLPLFGLSPKLGPIANWKLNLDRNAIVVNTEDYSTNVPGIYAIGDINTYPGKLKLILCGFHEAALMSHSAYRIVSGGKKASFKYTTVNGAPTL
ncbi:MAG: NAD(P)/FAD-dependent oxidoreductase [Cyclobacteriaceae bacterium]